MNDPDLIVISAPVLTIVAALLIPLVNGILTKVTLSGGVKGVITVVLNAAVALITTAATSEGTAVFSRQTLWTGLLGCVISIASYVGLYKPFKLTSSTPDGLLAPHAGLGRDV